MSKDTNALSYFVQKIAQKEAKQVVSNNIIYTGIIKEALSGYYKVQLIESGVQDTVSAIPLTTETNFSKEDSVHLLSASFLTNGEYQVKYYIIGQAGAAPEELENFSVWDTIFPLKTSNASWKDSSLTGINFQNFEPIVITNKEFLMHTQLNRFLKISANFNTSIKNTAILQYGFIITFTTEDDLYTTDYIWTSNSFLGQEKILINSYQKELISLSALHIPESKSILSISVTPFIEGSNAKQTNLLSSEDSICAENLQLEVCKQNFEIANNFLVTVTENDSSPNYFIQNNSIDEVVTEQATVYYNGQKMDTEQLKYYWCVEDLSIDSITHSNYNSICGLGWSLLNSFILEKKILANGKSFMFKKYSTSASSIDFLESSNIFNRYETKIKCIVEYLGILISSQEKIIYNYNYAGYSAKLITNAQFVSEDLEKSSIYLMRDGEKVEITCELQEDLEIKKGGAEKKYKWNLNNIVLEQYNNSKIVVIATSEVLSEQASYRTEIISGILHCYIAARSTIECQCTVSLEQNGNIVADGIETSLLTVRSEFDVPATKEYYIAWAVELPNLSFVEMEGAIPSWSNPNILWKGPFKEEDPLFNSPPEELRGYLYQYVTSRDIFSINTNQNWVSNWTYPIIKAKGDKYESFSPASEESVNELNVFNSLTQGGTKDTLSFDPETENLYINATYINTGTLRVGEENTEKFYASIHDKNVRIGGFKVSEDALESDNGKVGISSNDECYAFWSGEKRETGQRDFDPNLDPKHPNIKILMWERIDDLGDAYIEWEQEGINAVAAWENINGELRLYRRHGGNEFQVVKDNQDYYVYEATVPLYIDEQTILTDKWKAVCTSKGESWNSSYIYTNQLTAEIKAPPYYVKHDGSVVATKGMIGGFHIQEDHLASGDPQSSDEKYHKVLLSPGYMSNNKEYVFWAGTPRTAGDDSTRPFWIDTSGSVSIIAEVLGKEKEDKDLLTLNGSGLSLTSIPKSSEANYFTSSAYLHSTELYMSDASLQGFNDLSICKVSPIHGGFVRAVTQEDPQGVGRGASLLQFEYDATHSSGGTYYEAKMYISAYNYKGVVVSENISEEITPWLWFDMARKTKDAAMEYSHHVVFELPSTSGGTSLTFIKFHKSIFQMIETGDGQELKFVRVGDTNDLRTKVFPE